MLTEPNSAPKPSSAPRNAHNKEEPSHNTYFQRVKENKKKAQSGLVSYKWTSVKLQMTSQSKENVPASLWTPTMT